MNCGHYTLRKDRVCFEITMELLLKSFSVFLLFCVNVNDGKMFRRDYEWSDKAGGWLKYHAVPTTWNNARMRCEAEGATLASPLTNDLKAGIVSFLQMKTDPENYVFSGVHSIFSDGVYTSIEGVPLSRLAVTWEEHEPDNDDDAERCLAMRVASQGAMADVRCETLLSYVCYRPDTNLTINDCGTIDPEYIMDIRTGSSYKFHRQGVSWSQAFMTCDAEGGYLAIIDDESEASFIKKFIKTESEKPIHAQFINSVFVGFHDWGTFGSSFKTIHGENMESLYYRWARGQPDNSTIKDFGADLGEFCGSVTMEDVLLNDSYCDSKLTFLCEKEPSSLM